MPIHATQQAMRADGARLEVVVAYDGGAAADGALWLGGLLARQSGASLTVVAVYAAEPAFHADTDHVRLVLAAEADEHLERAEGRLPYGLKAQMRAIRSHSIPNALHDLAADDSVGLVVVGGRPQPPALAASSGNVAERLVTAAARCGVAVVPQGAGDGRNAGLHVIGVAYDGSPESDAALATAERIALAAHATLHIIGVLEPAAWCASGLPALAGYAEPEARARGRLDRALARAVARAASDVCALAVRATGPPALELARQASDLDLLVAGSRGYGPPGSVSLGSVSSALLRSLPCPVLIVPRPDPDREGDDPELSSAEPAARGWRESVPRSEYPSPART